MKTSVSYLEPISKISDALFRRLCPPCYVVFLAHTRLVWAAKSALPDGQMLEKSLTHIFKKSSGKYEKFDKISVLFVLGATGNT
jgi:hypothetical protein